MQTPVWNEVFEVWQACSDGGSVELQLWDRDRGRFDEHIATTSLRATDVLGALPGANTAIRGGDEEAPACEAAESGAQQCTAGGRHQSRSDTVLDMQLKGGSKPVRLRIGLTWVPAAALQGGSERAGAMGKPPWRSTQLADNRA